MSKHDKHSKHAPPAGEVIVSTTATKAKEVFVAGTFNDWNPRSHPLKRNCDGHWVLPLDLPPGRHEYKFVIDGQWCCESGRDKPYDGCPECVANKFGTMNRVIVVEDDVAERMSRQRQLA